MALPPCEFNEFVNAPRKAANLVVKRSHVGIHSPETDPRTQRRGRRSCAHRHRIRTGLFEPKSPLRGNGIFRAETKRPKRPWRFKDADAETKSR